MHQFKNILLITEYILFPFLGEAKNITELSGIIYASLDLAPIEAPFAIMYTCKSDGPRNMVLASESCSTGTTDSLLLEFTLSQTIGVPFDHPTLAPKDINIYLNVNLDVHSQQKHIWPFRKACEERRVVEVNLTPKDTADIDKTRGYAADIRNAVILPIHTGDKGSIVGLVVLGLNPRLPNDADYKAFISHLHQQINNVATTVKWTDEENKRYVNVSSKMKL